MIHDIPKPEISPNFTIEDIHKIREWHYEKRKDMSEEAYRNEVYNNAMLVQKRIEEARSKYFTQGKAAC